MLSKDTNTGLHTWRNCEALVTYEEQCERELISNEHTYQKCLCYKIIFYINVVKPSYVDDGSGIDNYGLVIEEVTTTTNSQSGIEK